MDAGTSVDELMQRAGSGAAQYIWRISGDMPTIVLCGPGNNGGDGYVIAQRLREKGVNVSVAATGEPKTDAAKNARAAWKGDTRPLKESSPAPQFVDCLFGTGLTRPVGDDLLSAHERLSQGARRRVAVDLPSGVHSDNGSLLNTVSQYDLTIALGAFKPAHYLEPSKSVMGTVVGVDIGVTAHSKLKLLSKPKISQPLSSDHKYTRGLVAVVAGAMAGAAGLAALAAQKSGAGYVKILNQNGALSPKQSIVAEKYSEPTALKKLLSDERISVVVIGPGLGRDRNAMDLLEVALEISKPLILDADALKLLGENYAERVKDRKAATIATPHQGEFSNIQGQSTGSKLEDAGQLAFSSASTILLKGSDTVIADEHGDCAIARENCPWLSTAGSGDVLSGVVAARLAAGNDALTACKQAQWLHTRAGQLAGPAFSPETLIEHLPLALGECL